MSTFTGTIITGRDVTAYADSPEEAKATILQLYESGDSCAELGTIDIVDIRRTDEDGVDFLNVYLTFEGEKATMMRAPAHQVPADTTELTDDILREIFIGCLSTDRTEENEKYVSLVAGWDSDKTVDAVYELCGLYPDNVALIERKHADTLRVVRSALDDCCGSDSSTYAACGAYNELLESLSVRVIPFPPIDPDGGRWDYTK
jgi:hypothetical protein